MRYNQVLAGYKIDKAHAAKQGGRLPQGFACLTDKQQAASRVIRMYLLGLCPW
jgi:hypothetical protein